MSNLVLGATGSIGSTIVNDLTSSHKPVRQLVRNQEKARRVLRTSTHSNGHLMALTSSSASTYPTCNRLPCPKMLTPQVIQEADLVVTMGCSVEAVCPKPMIAQMKKKLRDWHLNDPKGKSTEEVRQIRNTIELKVRMLSEELIQPGAKTP